MKPAAEINILIVMKLLAAHIFLLPAALYGCGPGAQSTATAKTSTQPVTVAQAQPLLQPEPEEPVKVSVFQSREGLGLLESSVSKKFNFKKHMLVAVGDLSTWELACDDKEKVTDKIKIVDAKKVKTTDAEKFDQTLPAGVYYQKLKDEMIVLAYIKKDDNKVPGKCPDGKPQKPAEEKTSDEKKDKENKEAEYKEPLAMTLYCLPCYKGTTRSLVYESHIPCLPPLPPELSQKTNPGK